MPRNSTTVPNAGVSLACLLALRAEWKAIEEKYGPGSYEASHAEDVYQWFAGKGK